MTGYGLPLNKCEAYNRVYEQPYESHLGHYVGFSAAVLDGLDVPAFRRSQDPGLPDRGFRSL